MSKHKNRKHHRASSVTPQKLNTRADKVDLTGTDPWAHQARMAQRDQSGGPTPAQKPTPLSPSFFSGKASRIRVPQDPNVDPTVVYQRLAAVKADTKRQPTFIGAVRLDDDEDEDSTKNSDETLGDETRNSGQHEVKDKKKKKKSKEGKSTEKSTRPVDEAGEAIRTEKKKKVKAQMEQQTARAIEGMQAAAGVTVNDSRKRKREEDDGEEFKRRVEVEANAVKTLRETLPTFILERVSRAMEREHGTKPTEMAVLLTAAKDTVLDLARAQLFHTQQVSNVVQTEMSRVLQSQAKRIKELETEGRYNEPASASKPNRTVAETLDETSSEGSDHDSEDEVAETVGIPTPAKRKLAQFASGSSKPLDHLCRPQAYGLHERQASLFDQHGRTLEAAAMEIPQQLLNCNFATDEKTTGTRDQPANGTVIQYPILFHFSPDPQSYSFEIDGDLEITILSQIHPCEPQDPYLL
ncbi:hypothetical protein H2200_000436 [Cladophialophora chaetospira]|uniref:Uncharacterized protein n=1 Tax=Cladophialophora chaetospira TaxID=386627 RepID=A0AA38XNJ0_9EURO|nr:hypothetical protein H2200_000436 [Cladophialophora chaetospira]